MIYEQGRPYAVPVTAGKKITVCRCGRTGNAPFCDGTHKRLEGVTPFSHLAERDGTVYLCGCGNSGKLPFCDGTHKQQSKRDPG